MKNVVTVLIISGLVTVYSCKGKKEQTEQTEQTSQTTPSQSESETKPSGGSSSEPKTYEATASPDSAVLGKNKEALIRIKNLKAIELSNPDGQVTGMELTYDIEVTNKNSIGGSSVFISPADFRLELDNGTKLTHDNYNSVSVQPEATSSSSDNKFKLPKNAKPTALNLFYNETRATVKLELK